MLIYFFQAFLPVALQEDKILIKIFLEYANYANIFFLDLIIMLSKNIDINKHIIKLIESKQLPYKSIYSLSLIEFKTLKIYIKTHLKTGFIYSSKFPIDTFILFNKKFDSNFCPCVNYKD